MDSSTSSRTGGPNRRRSSSFSKRRQEVLRVVLLDLEVLVAGHPEGVHAEHLHAGEQPLQVLADHVLERDEPLVRPPARTARRSAGP